MQSHKKAQISKDVILATQILSQHGCVAIPTETVYGLAGSAFDDIAVKLIFQLKNRPSFNPLIVHVRDIAAAQALVKWSNIADKLAIVFWPGPLTLVLPLHQPSPISKLVTAQLNTVAVRVPNHPMMQQLLHMLPFPLAAPSANRSGRVSPTTAQMVADDLGDDLPLILDGGPCRVGIESTIVDGTTGHVLREGVLTTRMIERTLGTHAATMFTHHSAPHQTHPTAPGQLLHHYAVTLPLRLNATHVEAHEALLAFGPPLACTSGVVHQLSLSCNVTKAAQHLFAALNDLSKRAQAAHLTRIAVMPIPSEGVGRALNDRLTRAQYGLPSTPASS